MCLTFTTAPLLKTIKAHKCDYELKERNRNESVKSNLALDKIYEVKVNSWIVCMD